MICLHTQATYAITHSFVIFVSFSRRSRPTSVILHYGLLTVRLITGSGIR